MDGDRVAVHHILGIIAHGKLGLKKTLDPLPAFLGQEKNQEHPDVQWMQAWLQKDRNRLKILDHKYPDRWHSVQMKLLQKALELTNKR